MPDIQSEIQLFHCMECITSLSGRNMDMFLNRLSLIEEMKQAKIIKKTQSGAGNNYVKG